MLVSGKINISVTRVSDGKNIILTHFDTKEELIQVTCLNESTIDYNNEKGTLIVNRLWRAVASFLSSLAYYHRNFEVIKQADVISVSFFLKSFQCNGIVVC